MKRLRTFGSLILALLRELADENAYRRHLAVHEFPQRIIFVSFDDETATAYRAVLGLAGG